MTFNTAEERKLGKDSAARNRLHTRASQIIPGRIEGRIFMANRRQHFLLGWLRPQSESKAEVQKLIETVLSTNDVSLEMVSDRIARRLRWNRKIPSTLWSSIISSTLLELKAKGTGDAETFLYAARDHITSQLNQPKQTFLVVTQMNLQWHRALGTGRTIEGVKISFRSKRPTFLDEPQWHDSSVDHYLPVKEVPEHMWVLCSVTAFNEQRAVEVALSSLGLVRGLWNLYLTRLRESHTWDGTPNPLSVITWGPVFTVHDEDGSLSESNGIYHSFEKSRHPLASVEDVLKQERYARKKLSQLNPVSRTAFMEIFSHYVGALDTARDMNLALSRLWSVLERIALGEQKEHHVAIPRRIATIFVDQSTARMVLDDIRRLRNAYIHTLQNISTSAQFLAVLNFYVAQTLIYFIDHAEVFGSIEKFTHFLRLRAEMQELNHAVSSEKWFHTNMPVMNSGADLREGKPLYVGKVG